MNFWDFFPFLLTPAIFGNKVPIMSWSEQTSRAINRALYKVLTPLVRVMVKHGMYYGTFAEIARAVFVEQAYSQLQEDGDKTTASAVSALTGLSRKEVSRLTNSDDVLIIDTEQKRHRAAQVISGWSNDPQFSEAGRPKALTLSGAGASFPALVKRYGSDVTVTSMRSLLTRNGAIESDGEQVILLTDAYMPMDTPLERLEILGTDANELISTIAHNISAQPSERVFQRKVSFSGLSDTDLEDFRRFSDAKSQSLLEAYDAWLADRVGQHTETDSRDESHSVSVGIYFNSSHFIIDSDGDQTP
jgi:hypothetical protein